MSLALAGEEWPLRVAGIRDYTQRPTKSPWFGRPLSAFPETRPVIRVTEMTYDAERGLLHMVPVHIEVTSTLTQEDENRIAPAVLKLLSGILEMLPVAYMVRIETADQQVLEQGNPRVSSWETATSAAGDVTAPFVES